jgi:hypothetical protein
MTNINQLIWYGVADEGLKHQNAGRMGLSDGYTGWMVSCRMSECSAQGASAVKFILFTLHSHATWLDNPLSVEVFV